MVARVQEPAIMKKRLDSKLEEYFGATAEEEEEDAGGVAEDDLEGGAEDAAVDEAVAEDAETA